MPDLLRRLSSASAPTGKPAARNARTLAAFPGAIWAHSGTPSGTRCRAAAESCAEAATPVGRVDLDRRLPTAGDTTAEQHDAAAARQARTSSR